MKIQPPEEHKKWSAFLVILVYFYRIEKTGEIQPPGLTIQRERCKLKTSYGNVRFFIREEQNATQVFVYP